MKTFLCIVLLAASTLAAPKPWGLHSAELGHSLSAPLVSHAPLVYSEPATVIHEPAIVSVNRIVSVPQVVSVRKVVSVPRYVSAPLSHAYAPSFSSGW